MLAAPVHVFLAMAVTTLIIPFKFTSPSARFVARAVELVMVIACLLIAARHYVRLTSTAWRPVCRTSTTSLPSTRSSSSLARSVLLSGYVAKAGWSLSMILAFLAYAAFGFLVPQPIGFSG